MPIHYDNSISINDSKTSLIPGAALPLPPSSLSNNRIQSSDSPIPQPTTDFPQESPDMNKDFHTCPNCKKEMVVYDKINKTFICLNNKDCDFKNETLRVSQVAANNLQIVNQPVQPKFFIKDIKTLADIKGNMCGDFIITEDKQKAILKIEGQNKEIHISIDVIGDNFGLKCTLVGKKQIVTYEEIEEPLQ